jgi:hypothetical protein
MEIIRDKVLDKLRIVTGVLLLTVIILLVFIIHRNHVRHWALDNAEKNVVNYQVQTSGISPTLE